VAVIDLDPRLTDGTAENSNSTKINFIILNIKKKIYYVFVT
jgi:hypothetical protein